MVLASITLLPALLGLAGHRINGRRSAAPGPPALGWRRWGAHVGRHATAYVVGGPRSCCSPWPRRSSRCASASPTRARCRSRGPSAGPTTWSPRGSDPAPTDRWSIAVDVADDPAVARRRSPPQSRPTRASPSVVDPTASIRTAGVATLVARADQRAPVRGHPRDHRPAALARSSRRCSPAARPRAHVGGQVAIFADLGTGCRTGCRGSWRPCCCCRSSC